MTKLEKELNEEYLKEVNFHKAMIKSGNLPSTKNKAIKQAELEIKNEEMVDTANEILKTKPFSDDRSYHVEDLVDTIKKYYELDPESEYDEIVDLQERLKHIKSDDIDYCLETLQELDEVARAYKECEFEMED